jgi:predicted ArsR family transcriptional regulator
MPDQQIPDDVRRFIASNVPSVPYLEAILLLRNRPMHLWSSREVADRLYIAEKAVREILTDLTAAGIVSVTEEPAPAYRYQPSSPRLGETVDQLAVTYASHLVEVTNLIHSKSSKKAQQFADAFRWREEK